MSWKIMRYNDHTANLIRSDFEELKGKPEPVDIPDGKFKALIIDFCLSSSCYATMALREVMKMDTSVETHMNLDNSTQKEIETSKANESDQNKTSESDENKSESDEKNPIEMIKGETNATNDCKRKLNVETNECEVKKIKTDSVT